MTTDVLPLQVDMVLVAIDGYIKQHYAIGRAKTADTYKARLRWFLRWVQEAVPDNQDTLEAEDFTRFEEWLHTAKSSRLDLTLNYYMRNQTLKRLRMMLRWGFRNGYLWADYSELVPGAAPTRELEDEVQP